MPWNTHKADKYEQEARKLVDDELAALGQRKHSLLRRKSKLGPNDRGAITAAFNKYAASSPSLPEDMVAALFSLLKTTTPNVNDLNKEMNDLFMYNAKCSSSSLVASLASEAQPDVVGSVLSDAIRTRDTQLVDRLLHVGANPKFLSNVEVIDLVKLNTWMFQKMQSKFPLAASKIHALCIHAIGHGDADGLAALMNGSVAMTSKSGSGMTALHRDELLSMTLRSGQHNIVDMLEKIAAPTAHWPLRDAGILRTALDCTQGDSSSQFVVFELIFKRCQMPETFDSSADIEVVFHWCLQQGRYDVISLMTGSNLKVPAPIVAFVCENDIPEVLDEILKGDISIPDDLWLHTPSLLRQSSTAVIERLLSYMHQHYIDVPQKEQLLLQCISADHAHLMSRLIDLGADMNNNAGEVVRAAVQSGDVSLVKTVLTGSITVETLEYGLFVASLLHPRVRGPVLELLLVESGIEPRFSIVNYLLMIMLCDSSVEHDQMSMETLLIHVVGLGHPNEATIRSYLNSRIVGACLSTKLIMQSRMSKSEHSPGNMALRLDHEIAQLLLLPDEHRKINQSPAVVLPGALEELIEYFSLDPDSLPIKLLEKHVRDCGECIGKVDSWPSGIIDMLLECMSATAKSHLGLYDCMSVAIDFGQNGLFSKLLAYTEFSKEGFSTIQADQVLSNHEILDATLDHLNHSTVSSDDYSSVVTPWFVQACKQGHLTHAIHICMKSRDTLYITSAIEYIRAYISEDINLPNIRRLMRYTRATQDDLQVLWIQAFRAQTVCHLDRVRTIMQAGYRGSQIHRVMVREIALGSDTALISTILDNWQIPNSTGAVPTYDYRNREVIPVSPSCINVAEDEYNIAVSKVLSRAITSQRADFCAVLFKKGASLILQGDSLITQAVRSGPAVGLQEDAIIKMFLTASRSWPDPQAVLDYTLLRAVEYGREQLMLDLLHDGASAVAYGGECWYIALCAARDNLLRGLVGNDGARNDLSNSFQDFASGLARRLDDLDEQCAKLLKLHNAGFKDQHCFGWVFSTLCDHGLLTPHRAKLLLHCGASADHRQLLDSTLTNGDLSTFQALVASCGDSQIIEEVFLQVCQKISESGSSCFFKSNDPSSAMSIMEVLLQSQIKHEHLNTALHQLTRKAVQEESLVPVVYGLLRSGAQFGETGGETLGRCYALNDAGLMSLAVSSVPPMQARSGALKYLLSEAVAENKDENEVCNIIPNLLKSRETYHLRIGISHNVLLDIVGFIFNEGAASAIVVRKFFSCIKIDSSLENCTSNCGSHIETLLSYAINTLEDCDNQIFRCEQIAEVIDWMRQVGQEWRCRDPSLSTHTCSLDDDALNRLLLQSSSKGLLIILLKLLELQVDVDKTDAQGHSALFLATQNDHIDVVDILVHSGAKVNDGSLHVAMCQQNHAVISMLLDAGHDPQHTCDLYDGATPLGAFMQTEFSAVASAYFRATLLDLLGFMYNSLGAEMVTSAITSTFENAMSNAEAFHLMDALIGFFDLHDDIAEQLKQAEIVVGRLTYSALSLVQWHETHLTGGERQQLVARFEALGVKPVLYAAEGDQPLNATGLPERLQQKHAFNTKECAICGDKPENEYQIHAGLTAACSLIHGWNDDIICSECLQMYLQTKMFPHDDEKIKYKFPSTKVFCWAPKCTNTELDHHILGDLVDEGVFTIYDHALFQQELNSGSSVFKCAMQDCPGAIWRDEDEKEELKIFLCPVCFENTCMECNDLYEKHDNQPCPAGEEARTDARRKAEEELSEEALKHEKKCPKCNLMYQKYYGCDHIICGKNVYDNRVDKGCRFEFCNICLGAWPDGHTGNCGLRE